ncbi:alpha/beta hydrolase [Ruegeria sp. 2012CJ41-6]|uniref:Alpha/beta hydrolase n=1 Tax=Ruegeria spongiae TaxID=2942209 RepID=A0ABT0PXE2_9RHOB|nr:alpha/beta hydrolase [Ruegeria spongiae]MCL6282278.1 alpha/beta hydrolase [Ruegeria spongiae]
MRQHRITGHGGVGLEVFDLGPEDAPPILLIHGWSQHHLSWVRQYPLAQEFRLITPDLRGHGASDKPETPAAYNHSTPWAEDVAAIIDALSLDRPLLVGWSMGGAVAGDYVKHFGDQMISGFCLVDSFVTTGSHMAAEARKARLADDAVVAAGMTTSDQGANISATLAFVRACFHQQPDADDLASMVGFNMLCPPHVRKAARQRDEDYRPYLGKMRVPALVLWGAHDRPAPPLVGQEAAAAIPTAKALIYEDCGHSPFWEEPDRFNADLTHFARHCFEMEPGT